MVADDNRIYCILRYLLDEGVTDQKEVYSWRGLVNRGYVWVFSWRGVPCSPSIAKTIISHMLFNYFWWVPDPCIAVVTRTIQWRVEDSVKISSYYEIWWIEEDGEEVVKEGRVISIWSVNILANVRVVWLIVTLMMIYLPFGSQTDELRVKGMFLLIKIETPLCLLLNWGVEVHLELSEFLVRSIH